MAEVDAHSIIDWRAHSAKHPLTDKQQKIADKIQKKTYKMGNLRKECEVRRGWGGRKGDGEASMHACRQAGRQAGSSATAALLPSLLESAARRQNQSRIQWSPRITRSAQPCLVFRRLRFCHVDAPPPSTSCPLPPQKITAKERTEGELTAGQASTLVRNERAIDALQEEVCERVGGAAARRGLSSSPSRRSCVAAQLPGSPVLTSCTPSHTPLTPLAPLDCRCQVEDLEETLSDMIRDSLQGKKKVGLPAGAGGLVTQRHGFFSMALSLLAGC